MSISPPPLKRRRKETSAATVTLDTNTAPQSSNHLSIYSWNIDGIQPFIQKPITSFFQPKPNPSTPQISNNIPVASLRDFLRAQNWPTILFLQEVKISPSDTQTQRAIQQAIRSHNSEPDYEAHFCLPTDPHNARGFGRKVYGVCSIIRRDYLSSTAAKIRTVDWDQEGRIQILETALGPKLSIWNIYAVNGTSNPWKHSSTGEVIGTRHDRKLLFHKLMLEECLGLEEQGFKVVLVGDMNIARAAVDGFPNLRLFPEQHVKNREDFNKKFFEDEEGLRGVDTYRHVKGLKRGYTYYPRGRKWGDSCDRVDLIICSQGLEKSIVGAGILDTEIDRGSSDHVPLFAKFGLDKMEEGKDEGGDS